MLVYAIIHRGLYCFHRYFTEAPALVLKHVILCPASMYPKPQGDDLSWPGLTCAFCFYVVGFFVFLLIGWTYFINKLIPKLKLLFIKAIGGNAKCGFG
jgi:hypothetical protein